MSKPIEIQYVYKKQLGFTLQQKKAFETLKKYNIDINQFIRAAIDEKIKREWKQIKESKTKEYCPF